MKRKTLTLLLTVTLSALPLILPAQTPEYSLRSSINIGFKITNGLKVELAPEFRYDPDLKTNSLLIQGGLNYRIAPWLSVGGYYRLNGSKVQDNESVSGTSFDYSNRFALDTDAKISLKRFTPGFRLRFCNFTDFDSQTDDKTNYLRYRFGLDYNIKGVKFTPYATVEFYQKLSTGLFSKSRYTIGADYEFNKKNALSAGYSFANKFKSETNCHIFELSYKIKF